MARVRIKDIAQQAGVSPATVSRYLNNTPGAMTEQTRERIAEVVRRTGYQPLAAARSLRTDRSRLLGIVLADILNPYSSAMIEALSAEAAKSGYTLMTAVSSNDSAAEASATERLRAAGADALIVNTCGGNEELLAQLNESVPVLLLDREAQGCELDLVTSNNAELTASLVAELAACGCTRLVLFTEKDHTSSVRRERERLFLATAAERGLGASVVELAREGETCAEQVREALLAGSVGAGGTGAGQLCEGPLENGNGPDDERAAEATVNEGGNAADKANNPSSESSEDNPADGPVGIIAVNGLVFFRLIEAFQDLQAQGQWGSRFSFGEQAGPVLYAATFDEYAWNRMFMGGVTTAAQDVGAIAAAVMERALTRIEGPGLEPTRTQISGNIIRRASTQHQ